MATRLELHSLLTNVLGSPNVYFQPPDSKKMSYPAIVYSLANIRVTHADDEEYSSIKEYTVTFITEDPDSDMIDELAKLRFCRFDRHFKSENLNHYVFSLFF